MKNNILEIKEYYSINDSEFWLEQIKKSDWNAGQYLYKLLSAGELKKLCGETTKVLMLTKERKLVSFCTLAEQDDVSVPELSPWIGFVYTYPEYRGNRYMGKLLEYAYAIAKKDGAKNIYISTNETGLYEKYGYKFWQMMKDIHGEETRIYKIDIVEMDYSSIIGKTVSGCIDRPLGCRHPRYPDIIYPVNYGYVKGVIAADGEEQDVYVLGVQHPIPKFTGKVIAVYHRLNDIEDKWIVSLDNKNYSDEEILETIAFKEQYFVGELYR